ncbi:MAG: hypothetical protein K2M36_06030, partial [Clostridia bacterium]|nr:hypothetical protein [Clostridia bacterium]
MKNIGCLNCEMRNYVDKDIAPAFRAKKIIRQLDKTNVSDGLVIEANDHLKEQFKFELSVEAVYSSPSLLAELSKHKVVVLPGYEYEIRKYLIKAHQRCASANKIEYRHSNLGWTEVDDNEVFLYDQNVVNGKKSLSARKKFKFQGGSEKAYKDFLSKKVYPIPTLSLAMSIGYSAVVVSRLKDMLDCCAV